MDRQLNSCTVGRSATSDARRSGTAVEDAYGLYCGGNVYTELGSTWRFVMRNPDNATHTLGKLIKHVGADRVLWGSPQDQIQAFRAFQIAEPLRERHE